MLIVDAHLDLAWNALQWNRDLQTSVYTIRARESQLAGAGRGQGTVALPDMRTGRVALCFATLLARSTGRPVQNLDYSSPLQAYGAAQGQLAYYYALEKEGEIRIIKDSRELFDHMNLWEDWETDTAHSQPLPGLVISMESADPVHSPEQLAAWKEAGVRIIGPAHYGPGRYAGGTSSELGLTSMGRDLLREMEQLRIILDLTHLSDKAFWEALERFTGMVLASHNNCRTLVPHQRQFDDRQIRAIIERGGVIGAACDNWMLRFGWVRGARNNEPVRLMDVTHHIDHICQLAGNSRHAGIGSDLDGGFGREQSPSDLDTIADLQSIADILSGRGYSEEDISAIMHGNWLRLLHRAWS
ncbi:MAG TPA: membrane dipeptidase [Anaerolineales bacterium]|nr:membrane dipeptidase [Anaerolineales bacterium]